MCSLIECVLLKDLFTTQTTKGSLEGILAVVPRQQMNGAWKAFLQQNKQKKPGGRFCTR
jgi:hypothetical protein